MSNEAAPTGLSEAEMAAGLAGLPAPPVVEQFTVEAPSAKPAVRWLTDKKRVESYDLLYPFAIGEIEIRTVTLKRMSAGEVEAFRQRLVQLADGETLRFPLFHVGDAPLSNDAWDALDDDDRLALTELQADFLPARFRPPTVAAT